MVERLQDKINLIHSAHQVSPETLNLLQGRLNGWGRYPELISLTQVRVLKDISAENRVDPLLLANSVVVSPQVLVVDERVPGLCSLKYLRDDGCLLACGGIRHKRSACPPYAPKPAKTQETLSDAKAVVVVQAHNLTEYDHQKQLHHTLLGIEKSLCEKGFIVVGSWSSGPCRLCEPKEDCLGQGKCRLPRLRRYSMEGSGMAVFLTCDRIAQITGDDSWRLKLIEGWDLKAQSSQVYKSVIAVAVK